MVTGSGNLIWNRCDIGLPGL